MVLFFKVYAVNLKSLNQGVQAYKLTFKGLGESQP
jgi:hypothetical protein